MISGVESQQAGEGRGQTLRRIVVVFRNDDLSALSDARHERGVASIFERYGVPQTLGVIPMCAGDGIHNPSGSDARPLDGNVEIVEFIKRARVAGSEIALHGYTHRTNRYSRPARRDYCEFKHLSLAEQEEMVRRGTEVIERTLGVRPRTFIPPWDRLDVNTVLACERTGFSVISAGPFVRTDGDLVAVGTNCTLHDFPALVDAALGARCWVFLGVQYHSGTVRTPRDFAALERAAGLAAETPECEVLTIAEVARRYPKELAILNDAGKNIVSQDVIAGSARAGARLYRMALGWVPAAQGLEQAYEQAKASYRLGEYEQCQALSPKIEGGCRWLRVLGRVGLAGAALLAGFFGAAGLAMLGFRQGMWVFAAVTAIFTVGGVTTGWMATAPDTKRECWIAALVTWLGGSLGIALWGLACGEGLP